MREARMRLFKSIKGFDNHKRSHYLLGVVVKFTVPLQGNVLLSQIEE